jgi:hypothetical protein
MSDTSSSPCADDAGLTLFSDEAVQVDLFGRMDAEKVAFVFNNIVESEGGIDRGPTRFLCSEGYTVIRFSSRRLDWHQNLPAGFLRELDGQLPPPRKVKRIALGHSMGGFAAIALSRRLSVDVSVAFAPQFNPGIIADYRFRKEIANVSRWRYLINAGAISQDCRYFLVYDSLDADARHAAAIRTLIPQHHCRDIAIPHATHEVTRYLHDIGQLKSVTRDLAAGEAPGLRRLRAKRLLSPRYVASLSTALISCLKIDQLDRLGARLAEIHARPQLYCEAHPDAHWTPPTRAALDVRTVNNLRIVEKAIETCANMTRLLADGFDEADYYRRYGDVRAAQMRAVYHYVTYGRAEGRPFSFRS